MTGSRHLQRLDSVWKNQPVYFITTCTAARRPLLAHSILYGILFEEWLALKERHGWLVGRYVVMPDHVHFFMSPQPGAKKTLAQAMGRWKEWTAKRIMRERSLSGPIWQPEFFDHLLRSDESVEEKWLYVRENPVRAGLVARAEEWPYGGALDFDGS